MAKTSLAIEVNNLSYYYATGDKLEALENVNLDVNTNEIVSLIGPSGCGKSTLLRLISDLLPFYRGEIEVQGISPLEARLQRLYSFVFQKPVLYEWRNVQKNIELPLEIVGEKKDKIRQSSIEMLKLMNLEKFANFYPWMLSGGMQQKVALARALILKPTLLLMDEPFANLDEITREKMQNELLKIYEQFKMTILFVTHSISEAVFLSDKVCVFTQRPGKVEEVININLPRPRNLKTRENPEFFKLITKVRENLQKENAYDEKSI